MEMTDIYFESIKIEGYRGRNFELKMNPPGENTAFIMDGNTGKTTTIELLRWCFRCRESKAKGNFSHMWTNNAHVLDHEKTGNQTCKITINFKANKNHCSFKRITKGIYLRNEKNREAGDEIESIYDVLEIDNGDEIYEHDYVHEYLSEKFKFNKCAEYFCFDGEKAREVMMSSSNADNINTLLKDINQRITNPTLDEYEKKLEELKNRVYRESQSKLTDTSLKNAISKIMKREEDLKRARIALDDIVEDIEIDKKTIEGLQKDIDKLDADIISTKSEILKQKLKLERSTEETIKNIETKRNGIYQNGLKWIRIDANNIINQIKNNVKETGKLPEPYYKDLITECLKGPVPTCQICSRKLDDASIQRVKELEKMVAPHEVHLFLTNEFSIETSSFSAFEENEEIRKLIGKFNEINEKYGNIKLSDLDEQLIKNRGDLRANLDELISQKAKNEQDKETVNEEIRILKREVEILKNENKSLNENRIILDRIDETLNTIIECKEKTKQIAMKAISEVISEGVSSILGPDFSATLTEKDGLLLGENGFFSTEAGGMSGRLILSYCFAEAMTLIDPIIIDTPSGNIGSHREALAKHLKANHKQVILLCLPTEVDSFAPHVSNKDFIEIKNKKR